NVLNKYSSKNILNQYEKRSPYRPAISSNTINKEKDCLEVFIIFGLKKLRLRICKTAVNIKNWTIDILRYYFAINLVA
ncbi:hypothetical protein, partial [Shewanella sp. SG41-4]|uniref:hypothetical protein n=1 Tax=Shewanella sp. SG41-4 TaxID=2760976 RepID=UPI001C717F5A